MTTAISDRPSRWTEVRRLKPERSRVAGLDSVDAVDAAEQMIVVADDLAVEIELGGREIMEVAREALLERAPEDRQIVRRGDLPVVGKSGGVDVDRVRHAERMRLARHHVGEIAFRPPDGLGDRDRDVVGRPGYDGLDRVLDADRVAGREGRVSRAPARRRARRWGLASEASLRRGRAVRTGGKASSPW